MGIIRAVERTVMAWLRRHPFVAWLAGVSATILFLQLLILPATLHNAGIATPIGRSRVLFGVWAIGMAALVLILVVGIDRRRS